MKYILLATACLAFTAASAVRAGLYFTDTFDGVGLDTSRWMSATPFYDSSVAVTSGDLVLTNRGRMLTTGTATQPYDVTFRFAFTGSVYDSFKVFLRTNGSATNQYGDFDNGIFASFRVRSDPVDPAGTSNNIEITDLNYPSAVTSLARGTFGLSVGVYNDVRIRDTGSTVSLFLNNDTTPFLSATTSDSYGSQIAISNREGGGGGSWISNGSQVKLDYFAVNAVDAVNAVPETGSTLLLLAPICSVLILLNSRRTRGRNSWVEN